MNVNLAYGEGYLPVDFPGARTTVIEPIRTPGLPDERAAVRQALDAPVGAPALARWIHPGDRVCIVFTDITRATPNDRLIPWLLEYLAFVPRQDILLLNGLGTHRPNTRAELETLLTPAVVANYRVVNHEPENAAGLTPFGVTRDGTPVRLTRHLAEAQVGVLDTPSSLPRT